MITKFERRQLARKFKRKLHQKKSALLMKKMGGYKSDAWVAHTYPIQRRVHELGKRKV